MINSLSKVLNLFLLPLKQIQQHDLPRSCDLKWQAAGITRPASGIGISVAEEALEKLTNRVVALEMELEDAKLKVGICAIFADGFC